MIKKALILAAGQGTRLNHGRPKPAFPLLGIPLLVRTLFTLQEAGIEEVYIVIGYRAAEVRRAVMPYQDRLLMRIHWIENPEWDRPNGVSVLKARPYLSEPFLMTMCDHIFDPSAVRALLRRGLNGASLVLAVDRNLQEVPDLEDATRVKLQGRKICRIAKLLDDFDAIDTGLFLAHPVLFEALSAAVERGGETLSDGVQVLAERGEAEVVDYEGNYWQDVDTPEDVRRAEHKLLKSLTKPTDGPISRRLNRPISRQISRRLVRTPVRPGTVTLFTFGVGLLSAWIAMHGGYFNFLVAAVLFQTASILDGVDGEIARLKFMTSRFGEWLDTISDNLTYLINLIALTIGSARMGLNPVYVTAGLAGFAFGGLSFLSLYLYLIRTRRGGTILAVEYGYEKENDRFSRILQRLDYFGKRDVFSFILLVMAIIGRLPDMLLVFCIITMNLFLFSILAHLRIAPPAMRAVFHGTPSKEEPHTALD